MPSYNRATLEDVIRGFIFDGGVSASGNVMSNPLCLYSYQTAIAQWIPGEEVARDIVINMTSYSPTTSKHRNKVLNLAKNTILVKDIILLDEVPIGTYKLVDHNEYAGIVKEVIRKQ